MTSVALVSLRGLLPPSSWGASQLSSGISGGRSLPLSLLRWVGAGSTGSTLGPVGATLEEGMLQPTCDMYSKAGLAGPGAFPPFYKVCYGTQRRFTVEPEMDGGGHQLRCKVQTKLRVL